MPGLTRPGIVQLLHWLSPVLLPPKPGGVLPPFLVGGRSPIFHVMTLAGAPSTSILRNLIVVEVIQAMPPWITREGA